MQENPAPRLQLADMDNDDIDEWENEQEEYLYNSFPPAVRPPRALWREWHHALVIHLDELDYSHFNIVLCELIEHRWNVRNAARGCGLYQWEVVRVSKELKKLGIQPPVVGDRNTKTQNNIEPGKCFRYN